MELRDKINKIETIEEASQFVTSVRVKLSAKLNSLAPGPMSGIDVRLAMNSLNAASAHLKAGYYKHMRGD